MGCALWLGFQRVTVEYHRLPRHSGRSAWTLRKKLAYLNDSIYSFTDLPIRWVHYPSPEQNPRKSQRGLLLASYTWGEDSLRWGSFQADDRIRFALRDIADLHGIALRELEQLLVGGMSHSWAEDEYTFGAFATFEPHQEQELFNDTWKPNDRIHFAGEHTSLKHGWIEGAIESGIELDGGVGHADRAGIATSRAYTCDYQARRGSP